MDAGKGKGEAEIVQNRVVDGSAGMKREALGAGLEGSRARPSPNEAHMQGDLGTVPLLTMSTCVAPTMNTHMHARARARAQ